MAGIRLQGVDKRYPDGTHAVRQLDLEIADGELLVLLGPSGCGKSTVLRLIAGLEPLSAGDIRIGDRPVEEEPPHRRDVAMVFQNYALYGHMTVRENIAFPLRMRRVPRRERDRRVEEIAGLLELEQVLEAKPEALSGGQQQRVAMGRALIRHPAAFLLDEPLSNLDARLRTHVREEIHRIQRELGVTTMHVTHDQVEALSLGDRVAVLRDGALQQCAPGQDLYDRPANTFVAAFLGQPGMNLLPASVLGREGEAALIGVRPEDVRIRTIEPASDGGGSSSGIGSDHGDGNATGALTGSVRVVEELGSERIVHVELPTPTLDVVRAADGGGRGLLAVRVRREQATPSVDARISVDFESTAIHRFDADGTAVRP